jgi:cellulose synthase/poly-beta-1,6-N-acetylglucosamine synthase-like glycosyltransferase
MEALEILFWISAFIVFYTYLGYGILLFAMVSVKRLFKGRIKNNNQGHLPDVTLFIAAYNEKDYIEKKMDNTRVLNYPKSKLKVLWVTDGSDDGTPELLKQYTEVRVEHQPVRAGKIGAINRGMKLVQTPITVFCDANTMLGGDSILRIANLFAEKRVGCVSGEKRILLSNKESASGAGEGFYWKYESKLKSWDSELYSVVGAAGELFAIRTELFEEVEKDTLLDDFMISMRIAQKGYLIKYDPEAYAAETASANVKEELKRKIRICAGGIQSILRLLPLLNIFRYGLLSFQFISHRVLRWTITPIFLFLLLILNIAIVFKSSPPSNLYSVTLVMQLMFYLLAFIGYYFESRRLRIKALFIPYFFFIMNYAVFRGIFRYIKRNQSVNWERAKRA